MPPGVSKISLISGASTATFRMWAPGTSPGYGVAPGGAWRGEADLRWRLYGTVIGAVYADMYPQRVRAFVLDGAVDLALA
jgi:hypothetical protein